MTAKRDTKRLRIALQREGRLSAFSVELLRGMGLEFETYKRRLMSRCRNFDIDLLFLRDDDIPEYVQDGVVDLGIVGSNLVRECAADVDTLEPLGFGYCTLQIAVPEASGIRDIAALRGLRIATTYPKLCAQFLQTHDVTADIIPITGSVEITPSLDVADAICDLVSTGSTLEMHNLVPIATVMESEAVLIANRASRAGTAWNGRITQLIARLHGVLQARAKKYVMLNAPATAIPDIRTIISGRKSPTIVPLADPTMVAVHAVVEENLFWEKMERLKAVGASDILVMTIEKMIA